MKKQYSVVVGNVGEIQATSLSNAEEIYRDYIELSSRHGGVGRAAGEDVTLLSDGYPIREFIGSISKANNERTREFRN